jgi:hypothetical protein
MTQIGNSAIMKLTYLNPRSISVIKKKGFFKSLFQNVQPQILHAYQEKFKGLVHERLLQCFRYLQNRNRFHFVYVGLMTFSVNSKNFSLSGL